MDKAVLILASLLCLLFQAKSRNVLRIGLPSLGSPLWGDDLCCRDNPAHGHALTTFLYGLRAVLRSSLSVAVLTIPSHLIQVPHTPVANATQKQQQHTSPQGSLNGDNVLVL